VGEENTAANRLLKNPALQNKKSRAETFSGYLEKLVISKSTLSVRAQGLPK
jgi:hypothetical protein